MDLQRNLRDLRNSFYCLPWKILSKTKIYKANGLPIKYVSEEANWAIKTVGENIKKEISQLSILDL